MITIDGLTKEQVRMLDEMWALDTMEEMSEWMENVPEHKRQMVELLQEMLILASIDEDLEELSDATQVLDKFI
jgi:hypothetical protein